MSEVDHGLDGGERLTVVDALLQVLEGAYTHLPQKRAGYAADPVQGLRLLRRHCVEMPDAQFHRALTHLVTGLRDGHTRYRGPQSLSGQVAVLPFLAEAYVEPDGTTGYLASKVSKNPAPPDDAFVEGVRLLTWNGIPFDRAVDLHADNEIGGHPGARRARALESLTLRSLQHGPPPDEQWVHVGFEGLDGVVREMRIDWTTVAPGEAPVAVRPSSPAALRQAADLASESTRRGKKYLFAHKAWQADRRDARNEQAVRAGAGNARRRGRFADIVNGRTIPTPRGDVGHLRVWTFDVEDDDAFLDEVVRLLGDMPPTGVIVDLRGNPGGLVWAAERMLQLFTDDLVLPTRFALLATELTRAMAQSPFNRFELEAWAPSLELATATGDVWSQPLPLTDPAWCNDRGRAYPGPAVAVVDAATYSSGDLFAAGWVDNGVGPLVSVGGATGAGGANVWTDAQLRDALLGTDVDLPVLPGGVGFSVSIRRAIRSGPSDGLPIEDLGVEGIPYRMTRKDLLEGNTDLLAFCAAQL